MKDSCALHALYVDGEVIVENTEEPFDYFRLAVG